MMKFREVGVSEISRSLDLYTLHGKSMAKLFLVKSVPKV
jgi:hypothetical protein